jgi:hypothetical protein
MGGRFGGAVRAALAPRPGAVPGEANTFAELHDRFEAATAAKTPEEEHAFEVKQFRAQRAALRKAKDDALAAHKLAQREADVATKAKGAKKRLTFRRTMNMRSQSVRWRRMTAVCATPAGNVGGQRGPNRDDGPGSAVGTTARSTRASSTSSSASTRAAKMFWTKRAARSSSRGAPTGVRSVKRGATEGPLFTRKAQAQRHRRARGRVRPNLELSAPRGIPTALQARAH